MLPLNAILVGFAIVPEIEYVLESIAVRLVPGSKTPPAYVRLFEVLTSIVPTVVVAPPALAVFTPLVIIVKPNIAIAANRVDPWKRHVLFAFSDVTTLHPFFAFHITLKILFITFP